MKNILRIGIATAAVAAALTATAGGAMAAPLELTPVTTGGDHPAATPVDAAFGAGGIAVPLPVSSGSSDLVALPFALIGTLSAAAPCGNPQFC
ncbi:hypothetical protein [Nocardia sp. CC227C]|uniref:hypothetical protein n=1 Tax=Nocardia sp. CC227C TaxID=3044562 RepID=UPI00278C37FE|nr:hypothetical protein [Nocardia sp. CC227C]